MNLPTLSELRAALHIAERRERLLKTYQETKAKLDKQLQELLRLGGNPNNIPAEEPKKPAKKAAKPAVTVRPVKQKAAKAHFIGPNGGQVSKARFQVLAKVGRKGLTVHELAKRTRTSRGATQAWCSMEIKRNNIERVDRGVYAVSA